MKIPSRRHLQFLQTDFIAEFLQPVDTPFGYSLTVAFIKVVGAEIGIGLFASEQMIGDHQNRMAHGHQCFLLAAPSGKPMEYDYTGMRVKKDGAGGMTLYPFAGYEIDPSGTVTKFIRIGTENFASKKGSTKYFYHNDHLGGVNVITDITGNRVQLVEYGPWGGISRSEGSIDPDNRFTGQKLDAETGLYYYGGRYYDPEISRFISPDPYVQDPGDPQNLNRYSYVNNDPVNYIDPSGYFYRSKPNGGFFNSIFGTVFSAIVGFIAGGPVGAAIAVGLEQIAPEALHGLEIFGGVAMLLSGNPAGLFYIAQGALGFCKDAGCQIGSAVMGLAGAAASLSGGSTGGGASGFSRPNAAKKC